MGFGLTTPEAIIYPMPALDREATDEYTLPTYF